MNDIDALLSSASTAMRPVLEKALNIGKDIGRAEAEAEFRKRLSELLSDSPTASTGRTQSEENPEVRRQPGTVKPVILKLIINSAKGMTTEEITTHTGFKYNSVRGTVWSLQREGLATKVGKRWIAVSNPNGTADLLTTKGASHAAN